VSPGGERLRESKKRKNGVSAIVEGTERTTARWLGVALESRGRGAMSQEAKESTRTRQDMSSNRVRDLIVRVLMACLHG
jgi:hypothetical protein